MVEAQHIRFLRLNQVFNKALSQSVAKLENWEKLCSCFPEYCATKEGAANLSNCQRQVIEFWTELCKREFEDILVERDVKAKLDDLDDLVFEANERLRTTSTGDEPHCTPLDKLSSEQLVACTVYGERRAAVEELQERLNTINSLNKGLQEELQELEQNLNAGRKDIEVLCDKYLGKTIESPLDETLVQGLSDMLLELRDA
ncbi:hypothetical protein HG535_0B04870 [Zygotorulaspora mrakii]|uniref:Kinetochore-associated protein n=1 Tax=Zygotorulaspora mrakii TaxID=42260 RepID=A0A7H9AYF8_ZYGMR|nr:uncharacterized protein HG535_0B04870 [Zygotorulaspora mrakii]QLG71445.1 hypothetical protein HG535_0B04870 [Zygotorulaspora mrakii]